MTEMCNDPEIHPMDVRKCEKWLEKNLAQKTEPTTPVAPSVNLIKDGKPFKRADDVACREYPNGCRGSAAKPDCDEEHLHPLDAKGCIHYGWGPRDA